MKIFISIASYQDPLLKATINSAFKMSDKPENLTFGVCDQSSISIDMNSFEFKNQIFYEHIDPLVSQGPCWARARIQERFSDEDYYLQIDSHTQFLKGWDSYLIKYIKKIQEIDSEHHKKPIITCYPRAFEVVDYATNEFVLNDEDKNTHVITYREDSMFTKGNFCRQIGATTDIEITHGYLLAAGFLFSTSEFVDEIPYDPKLYFYGEEISLVLRAITRGFGVFHIPNVPLFHLYNDVSDIKRKLHWDLEEDEDREIKWYEREEKSIERLNKIVNNEITGAFGLGNIKSLQDYQRLSGVDLINMQVLDKQKAHTSKFLSELSWQDSPFLI